jgi:Haem-binding domain
MTKVLRIARWAVLILLGLLLVVQVVRPARTNPAVNQDQTLEAHAQMSPSVAATLTRSCSDCHSNNTRWPWYSNVAPVSWFLINHVAEARDRLNISEWGKYDRAETEALLKKMCREVKSGGMPLSSYTLIHRDARLSPDDVSQICDWTDKERQRLGSK